MRAATRQRVIRIMARAGLSPVSADYNPPFPFLGTINKVEIDIARANLSKADLKKLEVAQLRALLGRE
jgi:hypothetical protein